MGHEVLLMPPAYTKPYVKRGKNDAVDADAICEEPFTVPLSSEVRHSDSVGLVQIKKPGVGAASQIPWRYVEQAACRSFRDEQGLF
jgi:hypothetical protein